MLAIFDDGEHIFYIDAFFQTSHKIYIKRFANYSHPTKCF